MSDINLLLVARLAESNDMVIHNIDRHDVEVFAAIDIEGVKAAFAKARIDHVIMGAGVELDARLAIVGEIFRTSDKTTVHMKDRAGGRESYLPFVRSILAGLREYAAEKATLAAPSATPSGTPS